MTTTNDDSTGQAAETLSFQAEVSRLLHLMVHSVYSEKDVFLRELISNASDACDKLRYRAVTEPGLTEGNGEFEIRLSVDTQKKTLTIADNGIGMDKAELIDNLGTIARSGTAQFVEQLSEAAKEGAAKDGTSKAGGLIGQFGVGFYSAFMVAESVKVLSRKAGTHTVFSWASDGLGAFTVAPLGEGEAQDGLFGTAGTAITLNIRDEDTDYLDAAALRRIVKTYSDHIAFPITLSLDGGEAETLNTGSALWTRPKSEIKDDQYKEFYHHVSHAFDDPWHVIHYKAEGRHEYTVLFFLPTERPFDLYDPAREGRVKLYVNRVFIADDAPILPAYLRFVRGVVDSADMPLNLSREMLQNNPLVRQISTAVTKRVLSELTKKADKDPEGYTKFWSTFGPVLKEGLYEDAERRDDLLKLTRLRTSKAQDGWRSLADIAADMKEGQEAIYYILADDPQAAARSPQIEGFTARGLEVLLLSDPVDAFWIASAGGYEGKPFVSVTKGASDLDKFAAEDAAGETKDEAAEEGEVAVLLARFKQALGEAVTDVRKTDRLKDTAVCLVAADGALDMHMERLLRAQNVPGAKAERVLEINPRHPVIKSLAARAKAAGTDPGLEDALHLLYDQARIQQGETPEDPSAFARRLQSVLANSA